MDASPLHERLRSAAGDRTYRHLAELTGTHAETVRRYMLGMPPSAEFLAALCASLAINADWLLMGHGPMLTRHQCDHALKDASMADLLREAAGRLDDLQARLEVIERYAESLVARVAAAEQGNPLSEAPPSALMSHRPFEVSASPRSHNGLDHPPAAASAA